MSQDKPPSTPPTSTTSGPLAVRHGWFTRWKRRLIGAPRDLRDRSVFHQLALIPVLAWVGLGADALSSSAYGPEEAFKALGSHTYLAVLLAAATAVTVGMLSMAYGRLVEHFPNGGGYGVATKLLGRYSGLVSGCALLVDYILTITISIAAAGDAVFSFLPPAWAGPAKLSFEIALVLLLIVLNLRGVKESILVLAPMFVLFLITHALLIIGGVVLHAPLIGATAQEVSHGFKTGMSDLGLAGMLMLFFRAYSLGGGTYTGIEAVSNALPLMREPRVQTAKRTMLYLAVSLAITAGGLLLCYLLWQVTPTPGKTMNAVLAESVTAGMPGGRLLVILTLLSEATLLVVAAQAGFVGGPRVCANMSVDSWLPHSFGSLSERLTTGNGVVIMGLASLAVLWATHGKVDAIVVMYSINVFLTFSLTMLGMVVFWSAHQAAASRGLRLRRLVLFGSSLLLCVVILAMTVYSKWHEGAWKTVVATAALVGLCMMVRSHYQRVSRTAARLYATLKDLPLSDDPPLPMESGRNTAVVLVGGYTPLGIHTVLGVQRAFPGHFTQVVFLSVGVLDSGEFKGSDVVEALRQRTAAGLDQYVRLATALKLPAESRLAVGTDAVDEVFNLCAKVVKDYPKAVFFSGKLIFRDEVWYHRLLHNNTAEAVQKRLHWIGRSMVILPARIE